MASGMLQKFFKFLGAHRRGKQIALGKVAACCLQTISLVIRFDVFCNHL